MTSLDRASSGLLTTDPYSPNPNPFDLTSTKTAALLDPAFHDSDIGTPNAAKPDGVPIEYGWHESASRSGYGNAPPPGWNAITLWGQLYAAQDWHPEQAPNTRVQIKGAETWLLSKSTHQWTQVQNTHIVTGEAYVADFSQDESKPADIKDESHNGGGISVTAGNGYNFHFWSNRVTLNPSDIGGVYTKFEARLIKADPNAPDDRASARYIANGGADYWRNQTADWASDWSNNGEVGSGRFKWVTNDWQIFSMQTLPAEQIMTNPPPLTH